LGKIGYRTDLDLGILLRAFQRHWRPEAVTGRPDAGTLARLDGMLDLIRVT
jgi:N-acetylmuramoyl-L-alanine amidase